MHLWAAAMLPYSIALGATVPFPGPTTDIWVQSTVDGSTVAGEIIKHCKYEAGDVSIEGEDCVAKAVEIMFAFMRDSSGLFDSDQGVVILNENNNGQLPSSTGETINIAPTLDPDTSNTLSSDPKRNDVKDDDILKDMNKRLLRRSNGGPAIRAVEISSRAMHPNGGREIRTNVHSGNAALHVNTNGSHATVAFKRGTSPSIEQRDTESIDTPTIEFQGMQGLKMQFELIVKTLRPSLTQLLDELESSFVKFVSRDGAKASTMSLYDSWIFVQCTRTNDQKNGETGLRGKFIALDDGAGDNFEWGNLIYCAQFEDPVIGE
jgi:hypothetical protein